MNFTPTSLKELAAGCRKVGMDDADILWMLNKAGAADLLDMHDATQLRVNTNRRVAACAENGQVAVVEGGMDCDCSRYEGHVHIFPANLPEFWNAVERMYYDAEGPIHWYIERPSVAKDIRSTSRDLALEAFENSHPHVVYC